MKKLSLSLVSLIINYDFKKKYQEDLPSWTGRQKGKKKRKVNQIKFFVLDHSNWKVARLGKCSSNVTKIPQKKAEISHKMFDATMILLQQ